MKKFWSKVAIKGKDDCWEWQAYKMPRGYGVFRLLGKIQLAHRVAWFLANGYPPEIEGSDYRGTCVLHRCDNRSCVNPSHLFVGTHTDNMKDMVSKGRQSGAKGEKHHSAKLKEVDVEMIRDLCKQGVYSNISIARMFDVTAVLIGHIASRKKWKHI